MSYFYFKPWSPQYFFPENFEDHPFFLSFFQSYSFKAKVIWWLWRNFSSFRELFKIENIEKYVPETLIRSELNGNPALAFNTGTPGPEQKITVLGFISNTSFFLKIGQSEIAIKNILNEKIILTQLKQHNFVPQVLELIERKGFVLLKTTVIDGVRLSNIKLNMAILNLLIAINSIQVESQVNFGNRAIKVFSHGDFCPWNLLSSNGDIKVFDWELAGNYPLGYDLFTFIFQTSFLLNPKITFDHLIKENFHFISHYFAAFKVSNWNLYLVDFAQIKFQSELNKKNSYLCPKYKDLIFYAQKA